MGKRASSEINMHKDSEDIWDYGFKDPMMTTNIEDFKAKKPDPKARPQRRIIFGTYGAGEDHVSFLEFPNAEVIFKRKMALPPKERRTEITEKVRLTSTHRNDFNASGFNNDKNPWDDGKPAGRPTPK
ncbi:hypothetical protein HDU76_005795, partial [Blyttiomyces sp. JEL0837]